MENAVKLIGSLGWPHISLIFGIVFIIVFNKAIRDFIGRIRSVSKQGVSTEAVPGAQNDEKRKQAVQELMNLGDSALLFEAEKLIREDLERRGLGTEGDTIKVLIRHLSVTQLVLDFEQIYNSIFGSQIFLLKKLNEVAGQGVGREFLETHFKHVQALFPIELGNWTLEGYLAFLFSHTLLTVKNGNYHITIKGVEFLLWLIKMGRREDRLL